MKDYSEVIVDGRTLELQYGFNALVDAELVSGCNLLNALGGLTANGNLTCNQLRGLLFAMVTPYRGFPKEPQEQLKACGQMLRLDTIVPIREALAEACILAISQEAAEKFRAAMAEKNAMAEEPPATEEPAPATAAPVDGVPAPGV